MAEGYGDIKGVMLAEQPAEGRGPAGSPGGAPKAFRTAASVSHGEPLGLQPPVDRAGLATREDGKRSAAAKRGGAHPLGSGSRLHGNALTKHRKWLGALQRTMRQARDQWEAVEERAEARKSRFEGFSAALRATIRAGGDVQVRRRPGSAPPPPLSPAPAPPPPAGGGPRARQARGARGHASRASLPGPGGRRRRARGWGGAGGASTPPPTVGRSVWVAPWGDLGTRSAARGPSALSPAGERGWKGREAGPAAGPGSCYRWLVGEGAAGGVIIVLRGTRLPPAPPSPPRPQAPLLLPRRSRSLPDPHRPARPPPRRLGRVPRGNGWAGALTTVDLQRHWTQAIWPALGGDAKKATGTVKPPPAEEEAPAPAPEPAEDAAAVSFQEPPAAAPVAAPRLLLKELRQEEAEEIDAEMDALVRDALDAELDTRWPEDPDVDAAAAADEEAEEGGAAGDTAAEAAGEEEAEEAEAAAAAQARAAKKAAKTAGGLPAWALTAGAAEDREEEEEADLLAFAEGLDYDEFLDDLDASQRAEAEKIVAKAEAAQKAAEEEVGVRPPPLPPRPPCASGRHETAEH